MKILNIMLLLAVLLLADISAIESNSTETDGDDILNNCLGIAKKNLKYCSLIKDRDKKSSCFGIVKRDSGYCAMVKNKDLKNRCLSIALSNIEYCDKISTSELKQSCKLLYSEIETESDKENCHIERKDK